MPDVNEPVVVVLPDDEWVSRVAPPPPSLGLVAWDLEGSPPPAATAAQVVVPPYMGGSKRLPVLAEMPSLRLVQTLTNGVDSVVPHIPPGVALANAAGVHDASTAELAVGLAIAALRGLPDFLRAQEAARWEPQLRRSLADRRVLLLGYGGIGRAISARLASFEVSITPVASRARDVGGVAVHGVEELPALLPHHDVVMISTPLTPETHHLIDARALAALPDQALVVNVARGPVVDTDALLAELTAGRLLAALDVVDPEPLPPEHPLWRARGLLLSPHVGGATSAFPPRGAALLRDQLARLADGRPLRNLVISGSFASAAD